MARTYVKTDNSYLSDKVALRASHLPQGEVRVLDCYAGSGLVWGGVANRTGRKIMRLPVDIKYDAPGFYLPGDNRRYLSALDLSRFNVIDLDAYGTPYEQLEIIFDRGYSGTVFCTLVQAVMGSLNIDMLLSLGYTRAMISKCPTMFNRDGYTKFKQYLAQKGVRRLWERTHAKKAYLGFNLI